LIIKETAKAVIVLKTVNITQVIFPNGLPKLDHITGAALRRYFFKKESDLSHG
jgi:hypothetical protein